MQLFKNLFYENLLVHSIGLYDVEASSEHGVGWKLLSCYAVDAELAGAIHVNSAVYYAHIQSFSLVCCYGADVRRSRASLFVGGNSNPA